MLFLLEVLHLEVGATAAASSDDGDPVPDPRLLPMVEEKGARGPLLAEPLNCCWKLAKKFESPAGIVIDDAYIFRSYDCNGSGWIALLSFNSVQFQRSLWAIIWGMNDLASLSDSSE